MSNANNPNEIVCNLLLTMDPKAKHIQTMVLIKDTFDSNTHVLAEAIRLRSTQDNADDMVRYFLNNTMTDIGDDFIVDLIEAEDEFANIPTTLMSKLQSRVAVSH